MHVFTVGVRSIPETGRRTFDRFRVTLGEVVTSVHRSRLCESTRNADSHSPLNPPGSALNRRSKSHLRRSSLRGQMAVGLVGVGPMWERRYRSAAARLCERLEIRVIYDAVLAKAQLTAADLGADVATGMHQVFERQDLHAVLVLDPAWYDLFPAELACEYHKPAFLAGALGADRRALFDLHRRAEETETLLMTEFSRRYTPATSRLRELIATRLGEAKQVSVRSLIPQPQVPGPLPGQACERDYLAGMLDWCQYITGRVPTSVRSDPLPGNEVAGVESTSDWQVQLGFRPDATGQPATTAVLQLQSSCEPPAVDADGHIDWPFPQHEIVCEHGRALIPEATEIHWQNGTTVDLGIERLSAERTDAEVMLDQFARRVLGGLVPVANVQDVCRALALVEAAEASRQAGATTLPIW